MEVLPHDQFVVRINGLHGNHQLTGGKCTSSVKVTEDYHGVNTGESSEVEAYHEKVDEEHIPAPILPIKNNVPPCLA